MAETNPKPPAGLSRRTQRLWRAIVDAFDLDAASLAVLEEACRSLDRADQARALVEAEGITFRDRFGQIRPHPAVTIERDARGAAVRALDVLGLEGEEVRAFARQT